MHKWPSMYRLRILRVNYAFGSAVSAVSPLPPTQSSPATTRFHCVSLTGLEFQPQTHRAVNWEKDATISFWGKHTNLLCFQNDNLIFVPYKTTFRA